MIKCFVIGRCLNDHNCYAYQYRQTELENCILIYASCSDAGAGTYETNDNSIIYKKGLLL